MRVMIKNSGKNIEIFGVRIDDIDFFNSVRAAETLCETKGLSTIFTPNPEILIKARGDQKFKNVLNSASLSICDGIGVLYASKILNHPLPERVAGFDLICALFDKIKNKDINVFLLGSKDYIVKKAKEMIEKTYEGIKICGIHHGYFIKDDKLKKNEEKVIKKINESNTNLLIVCLGSPLQEKWIYKNRNKIKANVAIAAGGALDVLSGYKKRAPKEFINLKLEWLYRIIKEPTRIKRAVVLPKFTFFVLKDGIKEKLKLLKK